MTNEESGANAAAPQDSRFNSSAAYLRRAASAVESGNDILGIHLYLAAYERALQEHVVPTDEAIDGMSKAWKLAVDTRQRSLAEYIFEKLEPFWAPDEVERHANELQRLAFDKLQEYGIDREAIEGMADLASLVPDVLCRYERDGQAAPEEASNISAESFDLEKAIENIMSGSKDVKPASDGPAGADSKTAEPSSALPAPTLPRQETPDPERMTYAHLVGFDRAIEDMAALGVGRGNDPEFARFLELLNRRHGLTSMPSPETLVFTCEAREDANYFMLATAGELAHPAVRIRFDHNAQDQSVLCVMASSDFKPRLSGLPQTGFSSPTTIILEDLDLWDLPSFDAQAQEGQFAPMQLSRGAREALALIHGALTSPDTTVLVSAQEPADIDPYLWDLMAPQHIVDLGLPDERERAQVWRAAQAQHPSLRGLDVTELVALSRTLSRFDIVAVADEAVEHAYRKSIARGRFCAVETDDLLARLASFQPLDSDEYRSMEDRAVERLRSETSDFDDLLKG